MPRSGVRNRANKGIESPSYATFAALPTSRDRLKAYLLIGKIVPSFQTFVNSSLAAIRRQSETFREPLNNKPYIPVKHAIQAFFQNTGLIFTQICLFSLVSCFFSEKGQTSPLDLCCGKFSTGNRQRIQIGTGKQGIQTIFVFL